MMLVEQLSDKWAGLDFWLVDNRYAIYSDGVVYDTARARDIPHYIFNLRDELTKGN